MTAFSAITRSAQTTSTWALARVEGRRLVKHPAVLAAAAFSLVFLMVNRLAESDVPSGFEAFRFLFVFLAVGTFIAANLGALRNHRHGTVELYHAEPLSARRRTAAHLLSVLWMVAVAIGWAGVILVSLVASDGLVVGFIDGVQHRVPTVIELALGPIVVGLFGVVGIMVARWVPSVVVPLLAVVAAVPYLVVEAWTVAEGPSGWYIPLWSAARHGGSWIEVSGGSGYSPVIDFAIAALAWHLLYLIGLIVIASVLALTRLGWTRRLLVAGAVGVGVASLGAIMQVAAATP